MNEETIYEENIPEENIPEEPEGQMQQPQPEPYRPRPVWQVWGARIGVVIMIVAFLLYCYQIATGGK